MKIVPLIRYERKREMTIKELQENVASEAKPQRLTKGKLKDVEFHTDKIILRESEKGKLHFTKCNSNDSNKILLSLNSIYSFTRLLQKQICIPESCYMNNIH